MMTRNGLEQPVTAIIIADQDAAFRQTCRQSLETIYGGNARLREVSTIHSLMTAAARMGPDLILLQDGLSGADNDAVMHTLSQQSHSSRVIICARDYRLAELQTDQTEQYEYLARDQKAATTIDALRQLCGLSNQELPFNALDNATGMSSDRQESIVPFWLQERRIIEEAMRQFNGNIGKAARALEISPSTIYRKIQNWHGDGNNGTRDSAPTH